MGGGQLSLFQSTSSAIETNDFNDLSIPAQPNNGETKLSRAELKEQVAKEIRSLVSGYHNVSGKPHSHIHAILNREQHVENQRQCTEEQLKDRVKLLQQMMKPSL